jgi:hypothetical protein
MCGPGPEAQASNRAYECEEQGEAPSLFLSASPPSWVNITSQVFGDMNEANASFSLCKMLKTSGIILDSSRPIVKSHKMLPFGTNK